MKSWKCHKQNQKGQMKNNDFSNFSNWTDLVSSLYDFIIQRFTIDWRLQNDCLPSIFHWQCQPQVGSTATCGGCAVKPIYYVWTIPTRTTTNKHTGELRSKAALKHALKQTPHRHRHIDVRSCFVYSSQEIEKERKKQQTLRLWNASQ